MSEIIILLYPQELYETTVALDREVLFKVIRRIEDNAPHTAKGLRALVEDFQTGRIQELLGEIR